MVDMVGVAEKVRPDVVARWFASIGARVELGELEEDRWGQRDLPLTVDVAPSRRGETFRLLLNPERSVDLLLAHAEPRRRHLLLLARDEGPLRKPLARPVCSRCLCGHDERHWFAAVVPERPPAATVSQAMAALRPGTVLRSLLKRGVRARDFDRRRNAGYLRQGEWFFVPRPGFRPRDDIVRLWEPLQRGRSKPHLAQELVRRGGQAIYIPRILLPALDWHGPDPNLGLSWQQLAHFRRSFPMFAERHWVPRWREPKAFVRGRITHPDHRTLVLPIWHHVVPNTESEARAGRNLVFLD